MREKYDLSFAKRPAEELYILADDPGELRNVAGEAEYAKLKQQLSEKLTAHLIGARDPRILGSGEQFDQFPYLGGSPTWPPR